MIDHFQEYIAAYMFLFLALSLFSGLPVGFVLGGTALLFGFVGIALDMMTFQQFFIFVPRMWDGAADSIILVAIPCFVFMGAMLERSGVASDLLETLQVLMRRVPGALALSVAVLGTIMAATTGIIGASVVMMTVMALPVMLNRGYNKSLASGTIAASATLGILIPPSIMLVIMADLLTVSVGNLFLGAIMPGLLLAGLYCIFIFVTSLLKPHYAPPLAETEGPKGVREVTSLVMRGLIPPVFLIVMVLGSIFGGWATPTEAAGVGAFGAILIAFFNRRLTRKTLDDTCMNTVSTSAMVFMIFLGATSFSFIFRMLYGDDLIIEFIEWLQLGPWGLLIIVMVLVFLLGFFFDWLEITLIVLPVFAPALVEFAPQFAEHLGTEGLSPQDSKAQMMYWVATLVAINLQTSFLTPPFGFALFYMKGSAPKEVKMQDIYKGIIPFILLQLLGLGLVIGFPEIALWLPRYFLG
jgi:tripartite ATP-independent transporter DctM subunit